jgi:cation diffusion facilitator family transporter
MEIVVMDDCCHGKLDELHAVREKQKSALMTVLIVNATLFVIEALSGYFYHSTSLQADSLDMFGDAFIYGMSIYALQSNDQRTARISFLKAIIMMVFGLLVLGQAMIRFLQPGLPVVHMMGLVGFLAFLGNLASAFILLKFRNDNINMRSTWICSRNDVLANLGVMLAAYLVHYFQSKIPDLFMGSLIAILVLWSAVGIMRDSLRFSKT